MRSRSILLLRLHLPMTGKRMLRIGRQLAHPFAQHILVEIEVAGSLGHRNARSLIDLTASSLNSRLNFLLCIPTLQFR